MSNNTLDLSNICVILFLCKRIPGRRKSVRFRQSLTREHVIGGVRETYDRYEYLEEKRDALTRLSNLIQEIIDQRPV
jgi:hypothetical protein